jgi:hypothetical protein
VVCQILVLLTGCTSLNIFCDPSFCAWPKVFSIDASNCFIPSRVSIDEAFVSYVHQFTFQALV